MLFAYVDESGDPSGDPAHRGSPAYVLGVCLVRSRQWADSFDALINLRRELRQNLGVPARSEIKAAFLVRNGGCFKDVRLSPRQRNYIYRRHFLTMASCGARAFAIFVDKRALASAGRLQETRELAWEALFQRLSLTHDRDTSDDVTPIMLVHDEGEDLTIRRMARKARRYLTSGQAFGHGSLRLSARWLLDDPVSRQSHHSLFIQCADLVAYAAVQRLIPGGSRPARVCPPSTWEVLGNGLHAPVNAIAVTRDPTRPIAIVQRP